MSRSSDSLEPKPDAAAPYPPRFRWLKLIAVALAILIGAVAGLWGWRLHDANADFAAQILAIRERHEPLTVEELAQPPVPDSENAVLLIRRAALLFKASDAVARSDQAEADRSVRANAAALSLLRKARAMPSADWQVHLVTPLPDTVLPELNLPYDLAKLLSQAADLDCRQGDYKEAVESARDILALQRAVGRLPSPLAYLVASAIGGKVPTLLQEAGTGLVPSLERREGCPALPDQLRALLNDLLDERPDRATFINTIEAERVSILSSMRFLDAKRLPRATASFRERDLDPLLDRLYRPIVKRFDAESLRQQTQWLKAARTGDNLHLQQRQFPLPIRATPNVPDLVRGRISIGIRLDDLFALRAKHLAARRLAAAGVAIRLYQADHASRVPSNLAELVPKYLPRVPLDPFDATGGPIRFTTNTSARLYCASHTEAATFFLEPAHPDSQPAASPAGQQNDEADEPRQSKQLRRPEHRDEDELRCGHQQTAEKSAPSRLAEQHRGIPEVRDEEQNSSNAHSQKKDRRGRPMAVDKPLRKLQ
jgi:hypothetical protein